MFKIFNNEEVRDFMFEFVDKNSAEFDAFAASHPNGNFLQAPFWSEIKNTWGNEYIISRDENGKVRGTMLLLIKKVPKLPYTFLYAPRGPVCDPSDFDALRDMIDAVKQVAKQRKGYVFKCDPSFLMSDESFKQNAEKLGLHIIPSGKNFEGIQPNFVFRLDIQNKTYDELFEAFHSKTRYNIRLAGRKGVTVRRGDKSDLPAFHEIMKITGTRDRFSIRPLEYFERMYDVMADGHLRLYCAELDGKMIAATIAIYYGDKVWYLYGASSNEHRNVMPNYLLQEAMIKWALEKQCRIYDFRGVSGDMSPENPLYGLYRFKSGFSGELVQFVGECEMVFKPLVKKAADIAAKIL